jgi:hypothetical protein
LGGRPEIYVQQPQAGHKSASVTAPRWAEFTSFAYLARTPRV